MGRICKEVVKLARRQSRNFGMTNYDEVVYDNRRKLFTSAEIRMPSGGEVNPRA